MDTTVTQSGALFALGFGAGAVTLGGLLVLLARVVLSSPILLKAIEALATSFPPEMKELVNILGKLAIEATDDIPADSKTIAPVALPGNFGGVSPVRQSPAAPVITTDSGGPAVIRWADPTPPADSIGNG